AAVIVACLAALPDRLAFKGGASYTFYLGDTSKNCRIVTANREVAALTRLTLSDVCGESVTFDALDVDGFLKSVEGEILFSEELSDSVNYYCKADLPYSVILYGEEINLHICVKDGGVTVASPIIFGGY
ncbi:MAG: hypothetical protein K2L72_05165, partial [Clostridia bacterium]|nr:hypothetical protein [Clostridia bacterium]